MRIVQLLPELNEGGVERGVCDLNREFIKRGIDNIVISNGGVLVDQITKDGGKHVQFDVCSKNLLTVPVRIFRLRKILAELKPDILHVRSRIPAWLVYFANRVLKIKVVSTVHGYNSINFYSKIMTKADEIICGSSFMIEHIIKHYNAPKDKINLIPRGIDLNDFSNENLDQEFIGNLVSKYDLQDKLILTQVARITQWKDQKTTINAFAEFKKEHSSAVLLLVGGYREDKEGYFSKLKSLVRELGVEKDVIFLGHTSKIKEIF
ncbi:MAG TPA: glycosyltransferase, partial [Arcobacter sp.]|nr:glycosyltransferase [Arcobacter sp.]